MSWIISLFVGLLTAGAGLLAAGFVADRCVRWYHVSSFEGGSGYFVVGIALLGGIAGLVLGIVVARWMAHRPEPGFLRALGTALAAVAVITVAALGLAWLGGDQPPELDGDQLALLVEVRMPAGWVPSQEFRDRQGNTWLTKIGMGQQRGYTELGEILWDEVGERDGRWVIPTRTRVFTTTGQRLLSVLGGGDRPEVELVVPLPARPDRSYLAWSEWRTDGFANDPARPAEYAYRFRVEPWSERRLRAEAADSAREAAVDSALAALGPDSPLQAWLPFAAYAQPERRRTQAMATLQARFGEYPALLRSKDPVVLRGALEPALELPVFPDGAKADMLAAGETLAATLERWTPESGPEPEWLRSTIVYWMLSYQRCWYGDMASAKPLMTRIVTAARSKGDVYALQDLAQDAQARMDQCGC